MALYVYKISDGSLYSWAPHDSDPVAGAATLAAAGLAVVTGLAALDSAHAWDAVGKTVVGITPAAPPQPIGTGFWILRFTPSEFQAITATSDATVQQFLYALNHTTQIDLGTPTIINGTNYLATLGLIQAARVAAIMAVPATVNGP